jgi:biotin carboxyl carrier protein
MSAHKFTLMLDGKPYEIERRGGLLIVNGVEFPFQSKNDQITISGTPHTVKLSCPTAEVDGIGYAFEAKGLEESRATEKKHQATSQSPAVRGDTVTAVMPGLIIKMFKSKGDHVKAGETLLILEAMKMQNEIRAGHDCIVKEVLVRPGQPVEKGEKLVILEG